MEKIKYSELMEAMREGMIEPPMDRTTTPEELSHAQTKTRKLLETGRLMISSHAARWELEEVPEKAIMPMDEYPNHSEIACSNPDGCICECSYCKTALTLFFEEEQPRTAN